MLCECFQPIELVSYSTHQRSYFVIEKLFNISQRFYYDFAVC